VKTTFVYSLRSYPHCPRAIRCTETVEKLLIPKVYRVQGGFEIVAWVQGLDGVGVDMSKVIGRSWIFFLGLSA
jgi:hypothetical protein